MEPNKVAKRDGNAFRTNEVNEEHSYIDDRYKIELYSGNEILPTGLLVIARIRPNDNQSGKLPEFLLRWDERGNALDVDPENAMKTEIVEFKKGTNEYSGHHPIKIEAGSRIYEINIIWGSVDLYSGRIGFSLGREVTPSAALKVSAAASSVKETANKLGLSEQHIRHLLAQGKIMGKRLGRDWVVYGLNYTRKRKPKEKRT